MGGTAVVELGSAAVGVVGELLGSLQVAAVGQKLRDARGPEVVIGERGRQTGILESALDHIIDVATIQLPIAYGGAAMLEGRKQNCGSGNAGVGSPGVEVFSQPGMNGDVALDPAFLVQAQDAFVAKIDVILRA